MLKKLFDILGMSDEYDDDEIVVTTHVSPDQLEDRKTRILRPLPPGAQVVLCRGQSSYDLLGDMLEALEQGRLVLVDLMGLDMEKASEILDSLDKAVADSGAFYRISRTTFLAAPVKTSCEEWMTEEAKADEEPSEEASND